MGLLIIHLLRKLKKMGKGKKVGWQFERQGYYALDYDSDFQKGKFVFNLVIRQKSGF